MATLFSVRAGCTFHPFDNGTGAEEFVVRTPENQHFRISASSRDLIDKLNTGVSLEDIYSDLVRQHPDLTWDALTNLIRQGYSQVLVSRSSTKVEVLLARKPSSQLLLTLPLLSQKLVGFIAQTLAALYQPTAAFPLLAMVIVSHVWLYGFYAKLPGVHGHASVVLLATLGSVLIHEFGHASAVARFGGRPGGIGVGFYIFIPVFFADVSQIWTMRRKERIVVDLGGIFFQQLCFIPFAILADLLHSPSFYAACVGVDLMTLIAINPVFRFDGYWVLVDWLGIPRLHQEASTYLKQVLGSWLRGRKPSFDIRRFHLTRLQTAAFILYSALGNLLIASTVVFNLRWLADTTRTLWHQIPFLWVYLCEAVAQHHWQNAADLTISLVFAFASGSTLLIALVIRGRQAFAVVRSKLLA